MSRWLCLVAAVAVAAARRIDAPSLTLAEQLLVSPKLTPDEQSDVREILEANLSTAAKLEANGTAAPAPVVTAEEKKWLLFIYTIGATLFYTLAILAVAYPAHLVNKGREPFTTAQERGFLAAHVVLLGIGPGCLAPLAAENGPVSIQLPLYMAGVMMWNMPFMYFLDMESFTKRQRTATIMIFWAAITLMDVGPQVDPDASSFPTFNPPCIAWLIVLFVLWIGSTVGMVIDTLKPDLIKNNVVLLLLYSVVQGLGTGGIASASKFGLLCGRAGLSGYAAVALGLVGALTVTDGVGAVCAAKKLNPAQFTPVATVVVIGLNLVTDFLVWGGAAYIHQWLGFIAANSIIVCGVYLLAEVDLFEKASKSIPVGGWSVFLSYQEKKTHDTHASLSKDDLATLFRAIDTNGDGRVSEDEMRAALSVKILMDPDDFEGMMRDFHLSTEKDAAQMKALSFEAFRDIMLEHKVKTA